MDEIKIIRSKRKTLTLQVLHDLTIVVKSPFLLPKKEIDKFITDHTDWINKKKKILEESKVRSREYKTGERYMFLGKNYSLKVGSYTKISIYEDEILIPNVFLFRAKKELTNWYRKQAENLITKQVECYAREIGVKYKSISFSDTKSKWGSCTYDNKLQFNFRLVMAPLLVINYVVIHELAHIIEKNHSRNFWSKVRLYNPSYKQQIKWLKTYGDTLSI